MRYPQPLAQSGSIAVVAPSFGATTEPYVSALASAYQQWRAQGYSIKEWPCVRVSDGVGISSTPARCAAELMDAYGDPASEVLLSAGGGELMCELLPYLDFERLTNDPATWFMGYSDNTNFGFLLPTLCDVASIYAPCAPSFGMRPWHASLHDAFALLGLGAGDSVRVHSYDGWELQSLKSAEHPLVPYNAAEKPSVQSYSAARFDAAACPSVDAAACDGTPGGNDVVQMQGRLLGGCLDILINLCGTRFDEVARFNKRYASDGVIWFLEACDLGPLQVRRALWQLAQAGWFDIAAGFMVGRPYRYDECQMGMTQNRAVLDSLYELGIQQPIIINADIGHLPPMMPLICGSYARVAAHKGRISVTMELV